jgi:hypothetical protein
MAGTSSGSAGGGAGGAAGSSGGSGTATAGAAGTAGSAGVSGAMAGGASGSGGNAGAVTMTFFVSSDTRMTGDLGGLPGADARCQGLAASDGAGDKTWHAYLSVEHDPANGNAATHAHDRIGAGGWTNSEGVLLAADLAALHARTGDPNVFLDEHGQKIPGQWAGSPAVEHDILTGSDQMGMVMAGLTCADWTSNATNIAAQVGHSDGLGPGMSSAPPYDSWNSSHANQSCADTAPRGGAGRIYCFAL